MWTNRREVNFGIFQRRMQLTLPVFSILMNADHHVGKTTCHTIKIAWKIPPWNCSNHVAVPRIPPRYHRDRYRTLKYRWFRTHGPLHLHTTFTRYSILAYEAYTLRRLLYIRTLNLRIEDTHIYIYALKKWNQDTQLSHLLNIVTYSILLTFYILYTFYRFLNTQKSAVSYKQYSHENHRVAIEVIKVANIIQALPANTFASEYVLLHSHITSCSHITLTYHTTLH